MFNKNHYQAWKRPVSRALSALGLALLIAAPCARPAEAQDVLNVNPVNVPRPVANTSTNATATQNLTPMAPTDPHAITHLPSVLVTEHNGANGTRATPGATAVAVPAAVQHAPVYPGLTITLTGTVSGDPTSGQFYLSTNGFVYTIKAGSKSSTGSVNGGDRVRVFGDVDGLIVENAKVDLLTHDAGDSADSYGLGVNQ